MSLQRVNILYQSDDTYSAITGVSMTSLLENNQDIDDIHIYFLDDRISETNKEKLRQLAARYDRTLIFLDISGLTDSLAAQGLPRWRDSYTTYCKLFAFSMLPEDIDRLLYLDSDTVVNGPIDALYQTALDGSICAMVQDALPDVAAKAIGLSKDSVYFNAGVIMFNAALWRSSGCETLVRRTLANADFSLVFPDQDVINKALEGRIKKLGPECNFVVSFLSFGIDRFFYAFHLDQRRDYYSKESVVRASEQVIIYHYVGDPFGRPWMTEGKGALTELWDRYLDLSPWKGMEKWPGRLTMPIQRAALRIAPNGGLYRLLHAVYAHAFLALRYKKKP